ncbi:MAG: helix-turn-helix domain-containing protein [Pseudonocardiaceae bacterium]
MTITGGRAHCPECGAQLRRNRPAGELCDPCLRKGPRLALPPGFYDAPRLDAALADYDFGTVFLAIRADQDWTQEQLGELIGLEQSRISDIERGVRRLRDVRLAARASSRLAIPPVKLGFGGAVTVVGGGTLNGRKGSWMENRRDFIQQVAAMVTGFGAGAVDVDRLVALLDPQSGTTGTRKVGATDVDALEHAAAEYQRWHRTYGGGMARDAATAQLRGGLPLLNAKMEPALRDRLHIVLTHLALLAAWMNFDQHHHDAARRLWMIGLDVARGTEDPRSTDLTGHILVDMAQQALYLHRPDDARHLVQLGYAAGVGRHPVSPSTTTCLATNLAFAHAARGDYAACQRALGHAEEDFTTIDPAAVAPWACVDGPVKLSTWQGHAYYELARVSGDQRCLERAVLTLRQAVYNARPISRALYLPDLSGAHALARDVDTAVTVGHQAVDAIISLSSRRTRERLRVLNTVLEPMHTSPGVAELRERLVATAA